MITVYIVWGSTYLGIRVTVRTIPPLIGMGSRFLVAGLLLSAFLIVRGGIGSLRVSKATFGALLFVGTFLLFGGNAMVAVAERTVPSGLAALLVAAVPLWIVVLRAMIGDRPTGVTLLGVGIGFLGIALLALPGGHSGGVQAWSVFLIIGAALSWAIASVAQTRLPMPTDPFAGTAWEMVLGGLVILIGAAVAGEFHGFSLSQVSGESWWAWIYLTTIGSLVGFTAFIWALTHGPVSLVSTYAFVNPVVAVFLGAIILSESVTAYIIGGGALAAVGVACVVFGERSASPTAIDNLDVLPEQP